MAITIRVNEEQFQQFAEAALREDVGWVKHAICILALSGQVDGNAAFAAHTIGTSLCPELCLVIDRNIPTRAAIAKATGKELP